MELKGSLTVKRGFEHLNNARSRHVPREMRPSYASLCFVSNVFLFCFFFRKCDKHSCSASAIINLSMVSIVDNNCQQIICCQHFTHQPIVFCTVRSTHISLGLAVQTVSLFSSWAATLVSRILRMRALPLLNLKKKRGCSQSSRGLHVITYLSSALLCFADLCRSLHFMTCDICWFLLASVIRFKFLFI